MNHALQAYNVMASPTPNHKPQQAINSVHIHLLYHLAKEKQVQHGSLVDRGANGGLAGSDVRILSKSSRKYTVTGIDQHQINGLDIEECAALAETNHGCVNLIMNEYAYYGKGHTIHSAGQIEWHKNLVDDKSVETSQVPFLMCTLEIPQKIAAQDLALNFCSFCFTFELLSQTVSLSCIFVLLLLSFIWIFQSCKLNILELL